MKKLLIFLSFALAVLPAVAQDYWRVIDAKKVSRMSQFERVQYSKANELLNSRQYRAAATEFDRFLIQYKDSEVIPYMLFLKAYALHQAKDRNKAVSAYNEVIDFYPGEIDASAPAMYYRGIAQFDNGDYVKGMTTMKELLDDADYKTHPVAASASLQLVRNYWKNKEPEKANIYLKRIFAEHRANPKTRDAANDAKRYYMASCASTGNMDAYRSWYLNTFAEEASEKKISPQAFRANMVNDMYGLVMGDYWRFFQNDDLILKYRGGKKGTDPFRELWTLMEDNSKNFDKAGRMWEYYIQALRLLSSKRYVSAAAFEKMVSDAVAEVLKTPDDERNKGRQQNRLNELVEMLFQNRQWDHAGYVNNKLTDKKRRAWNEYRVLEGKGQWDEALKKLEIISAMFKDDSKYVSQCNWKKAWILRDYKHEYDNAIKVYREIGEPPATLWQIAECHKRKKDHTAVIAQYIEIENAFPDNGPEAAWNRCVYYNSIGEKNKSIAEARRILKVYPKKGQASAAHQHLERLGVDATGGGVTDEEF